MTELAYDLHIHSCLSPCADDDNTPNNIVNMARLNALDIIALTDHNTCKNCPAIMCAKDQLHLPLLVLPGMELCTSEEIHVVCLFESLERAMAFDEYVDSRSMKILNRPEKFGNQLILNALDEPIGFEEHLLVTATAISIADVSDLMIHFGGAAFPAHIDRTSYSLLSSLGSFPAEYGFAAAEIADMGRYDGLRATHPILSQLRIVSNSDAHHLWDIAEGEQVMPVAERSAEAVLAYLAGR